MEQKLIISTLREGYSVNQVSTMTVEELINCLRDYEPTAKVYLSFDNGYTYGGIRSGSIKKCYSDEDDE